MKHKWMGWLMVIVGLVFLVLLGGSIYMLSYSLTPDDNDTRSYEKMYKKLYADYPEIKPWCDSLRQVSALRDTFVTMDNGEQHHAMYIPAREECNRTAVVVHGYTSNAADIMYLGYMYHHDLGFNVLLPDLHAHGKSEGKVIQMGWKDRADVHRWIAIADSLWRDSTDAASIVVHGVSMGAATTMGVSGDSTPASVKCFVEDCGYSSVWEEFRAQLKEQFGIPEFPIMYTTSLLCNLLYGWSFGEASPLEQVKKCHKPMLFIHGDEDTFVPTSMVYALYQVKTEPKELYIGRGSAHAMSYQDHQKEYTEKVRSFVERYL